MEDLSLFDNIYKVSHEAKESLLQIMEVKRFGRNELVQDLGSTCKTIYMIKNGGARIFYFKDGTDITEHFSFEKELIIRAESLFTKQPTKKGIQTLEQTEMLALDAEALFNLYDTHHDLERLFRLIFQQEYVNTIKRMESFQFQTATERYKELLETTNLVQKIPLKYIASYLGITQVSLSRIRASIA